MMTNGNVKEQKINKSLNRVIEGKDFWETEKKVPSIKEEYNERGETELICEEYIDPTKTDFVVMISNEESDLLKINKSFINNKEEQFASLSFARKKGNNIDIVNEEGIKSYTID